MLKGVVYILRGRARDPWMKNKLTEYKHMSILSGEKKVQTFVCTRKVMQESSG